MSRHQLTLVAAALLIAGGADGQVTNQFATGNMHFDAKEMDANGDGKVTKDEYKKYGEKMWAMMSKGAPSIPVVEAAQDFARGNLRFDAKAMDANHDNMIAKDEFMKYAEQRFDRMNKDAQGAISVTEAAQAFSRGNQRVASKPTNPKPDATPQK
jgi:hypothetical protein